MQTFDNVWEEIHATQEWGKYPAEHFIRFGARNYYKFKDRSKVKILDFGCGGGAHTWYLAREGFDTYAFDGSKSAIERVKLRLSSEQLKAHLKVADGAQLDYEEEFFDCVIDNFCIYSNKIDGIKCMYECVYNLLKHGGKLFTAVFSKNTTGFGYGREIEPNTFINIDRGNLQGRGLTHFFTQGELEDMLTSIGFKNIVVDTMEYTDLGNIVSEFLVITEK